MNERIRQLAEQAKAQYCDLSDASVFKRLGLVEAVVFTPEDLEKFAELIVQECVSIVAKRKDQAIDDGWNVDEAMSMAEMDLEEHFGVEE